MVTTILGASKREETDSIIRMFSDGWFIARKKSEYRTTMQAKAASECLRTSAIAIVI
jgi:hypothetical protein